MKPLSVGLVTVALLGGSIAAALGVRSCVARRAAADLHLEAAAFERGMTFGLELATAVEQPADCSASPLPPELSALVECRSYADGLRRTQRANEENARLRGWNHGYGLGRGDWKVQLWECPR